VSDSEQPPFPRPPADAAARRPKIFPAPAGGRGTLAVGLVLAAIVAGLAVRWWSGKRAETAVVGRVMSGGRPVVFGTVTILAGDDRAYSAAIEPDGRFRVANVPPGPARIAVSSPDPRPLRQRPATAGNLGPAPAQPSPPISGGARSEASAAANPPPGVSIAAPAAAAGPAVQPAPPPGWFRIPGRYADPATSGLEARIGAGDNRLDLDIP